MQIFEENWTAISVESYLDGHKIDDQAFGRIDADLQASEGTAKQRGYPVELRNPRGTHTLRGLLHLSREVNDGFVTSPAGTYEFIDTFTVSTAPAGGQPTLPGTGEAPAPVTLPETGDDPPTIVPLIAGAALVFFFGMALRRRRSPDVG